jgi:hypothetical protein
MGRLRSRAWQCVVAVILAGSISSCGGHKSGGISTVPARVTLSPTGSTSVQQGNTITFTALAQNSSGSTVNTTFIFASSDTTIMNIAPNGVACAGVWNQGYTVCTPAGSGVVTITATGLGATSVPTYVFVHPPIDNITVTGILLNNVPIQEPCLEPTQSMTVEAHAFSQGTDITSSVGPFTWSANNTAVVHMVPIVNLTYNFATNQASAVATFPGITQIYASASGVTSTSFQQPQYSNAQGTSPILDFFETCPIQSINLELNRAGSQQTTFSIPKGTAISAVATVTDVMGNSSLPNTVGLPVLTKIPLVWSSSNPAVVNPTSGCSETCSLSTPLAGAASFTASCSPPVCNFGYPYSPPVLSSPACAQFFQVSSCQLFLPMPVYASPLCPTSGSCRTTAAISGQVQGTLATPAVVATSLGCAATPPVSCGTSIYNVGLAKGSVGGPNFMPTNPNSLLFTLAGDRAYVGSDFGAVVMNPGNLGTTNSAFTFLGTVTGKILAISQDGNTALFSDTIHLPNQVYIVNTTNPNSTTLVPLNIFGASAAAFSPDGLKAFIFGYDSNSNPNLYVYSTQQALQVIPLPPQTTVNSIAFSNNVAFAYVVEPFNVGVGGPAITVYDTCDDQISTNGMPSFTPQVIPLTAAPIAFRPLPDGQHFVALESGGSIDYITATITSVPVPTLTQPSTASSCPQWVSHTVSSLNLQQGNVTPLNFFPSAQGSLFYVLAADRSSILVYNLASNSVSGIPLIGNAVPVDGGISADTGTIIVAGSDGLLHQVSTSIGGSDLLQLTFPNLPDFLNPFCTSTPASGACTFDTVAVRP